MIDKLVNFIIKIAVLFVVAIFVLSYVCETFSEYDYDDGYSPASLAEKVEVPEINVKLPEFPEVLKRFANPSTEIPKMIADYEKVKKAKPGKDVVCPVCGQEYERYDANLVCCTHHCEREYRAIVIAWENYQEWLEHRGN